MNWGWYWHVKLQHRRRKQCSGFVTLDSFEMFKNRARVDEYHGRIVYEIPQYQLKIMSSPDRYSVTYYGGSYAIPIDKQPCNYGGYRYYFRCPGCNNRMRLLYCNEGIFLCRKCLNLCYFTQLLKPSDRCLAMANKVERKLNDKAGNLDRKPPWMKRTRFNYLRRKFFVYMDEKYLETISRLTSSSSCASGPSLNLRVPSPALF